MDMTQIRYEFPKYLAFGSMYLKCLLLSLPLVAYGAFIGSNLYQFTDVGNISEEFGRNIFCLPLGLLCSIFIYPFLFSNLRHRALVYCDLYFIVLMITALILMKGFEYIYIAIGVGCGCGWAAVQGYVRETAGWEDKRASHINNLPNIMFLIGLCLSFFLQKMDSDRVFLILFSIGLSLPIIRLIFLVGRYNQETPVYHMKRFEELRGKLLLQKIYKSDFVDQIEYSHISNNEKLNDINRTYLALFQQNYFKRTFAVGILNITLWMVVPYPFFIVKGGGISGLLLISNDPQQLMMFAAVFSIILILMSGFIFSKIKIKVSVLIASAFLLLFNCILEVLLVMHYQKKIDVGSFVNVVEVIILFLFFLVQLPGIQMLSFMLVPDKGWATTTNQQWVGMTVAIFLGTYFKSNEYELFIKVYGVVPLCCLIQVIILACFSKDVQGLNETQIQNQYQNRNMGKI